MIEMTKTTEAHAIITPFEWPQLPHLRRDGDDLAVGHQTYTCNLGETTFTLERSFGNHSHADRFVTKVQVGSDEVEIWASSDVLALALVAERYEPDVERYPADAIGLMLEFLFLPLLERLETALGNQEIRVISHMMVGEVRRDPGIDLTASTCMNETLHLSVTAAPEVLTRFDQLWKVVPSSVTNIDRRAIPFLCTLYAADFEMSGTDVAMRACGDMLMLDPAWFDVEQFRLNLAGYSEIGVAPASKGLRVIGQLQLIKRKTKMQTSVELESAPLDLPVIISVELARKQVNMSDIEALTVGSVIPFDPTELTEVVLTGNGQPLGRGELVRVDSKIAIRLTHID